VSYLLKLIAMAGVLAVPAIQAQNCNLSEYKASPGLTAASVQKTLTVTWDGEKNGNSSRCRVEFSEQIPPDRLL